MSLNKTTGSSEVRSRYGDLMVIGLSVLILAMAALLRREFIGDGLRHLHWAFLHDSPSLGISQWILFPAFIHFLVLPFRVFGGMTDVPSLVPVFLTLDLLSGFLFLWFLRIWLTAFRFDTGKRALAIAFAASAIPFLKLTSDVAEPMFAAWIVMAGLACAAKNRTQESPVFRIVLPAALIVTASFFYLGALLGVAFLPLAVTPKKFFEKRSLAAFCLMMAVIPAGLIGLSMIQNGYGLATAVSSVSTGSTNPFGTQYLKKEGLLPHLIALLAGPPQGIFYLKDFDGLRELIGRLSEPQQFLSGVRDGGLLVAGFFILSFLVIQTVQHRNWSLLLGLAGILTLPVFFRPQQYGYVKFYIFLPVFLAMASQYLHPRFLVFLTCLIWGINGVALAQEIHQGRLKYSLLKPVYEQAGSRSCWMSEAWHPPLFEHWSGKRCAVLGILSAGTAENEAELATKQTEALLGCMESCFCDSQAVYTDDFVQTNQNRIQNLFRHFRFAYPEKILPLLWDASKGETALEDKTISVYRYSPASQEQGCRTLR